MASVPKDFIAAKTDTAEVVAIGEVAAADGGFEAVKVQIHEFLAFGSVGAAVAPLDVLVVAHCEVVVAVVDEEFLPVDAGMARGKDTLPPFFGFLFEEGFEVAGGVSFVEAQVFAFFSQHFLKAGDTAVVGVDKGAVAEDGAVAAEAALAGGEDVVGAKKVFCKVAQDVAPELIQVADAPVGDIAKEVGKDLAIAPSVVADFVGVVGRYARVEAAAGAGAVVEVFQGERDELNIGGVCWRRRRFAEDEPLETGVGSTGNKEGRKVNRPGAKPRDEEAAEGACLFRHFA